MKCLHSPQSPIFFFLPPIQSSWTLSQKRSLKSSLVIALSGRITVDSVVLSSSTFQSESLPPLIQTLIFDGLFETTALSS